MSEEQKKEFFKKNSLFSNLSEESLKALYSISEEIALKPGDFLMQEGDSADELFLIINGDLEIIKYDDEMKTHFVINALHEGDTIGEMALIDQGKRSASVRAATDSRLFHISFEKLEKLKQQHGDIETIFSEISRRMSQKLRETTDVAAVALKNELIEYKNRVSMGSFLVYVIAAISLFVFTVRPLKYALTRVPDTTYISIPLIIALTIFTMLIIRACPFPLSAFGFTLKNWKKSAFEGFFFTIPVLGLIVLLKWLLILFNPIYKGHAIFEPDAMMKNATFSYWIINSLVYSLFVPIQEIMARGALQGPLEKFLAGKHKVWTSIIISNLIFSSAHVFISEEIAIIVFFSGLFFGWLYSRNYNLIGVNISHILVGVWGLNIVGPVLN